MGNPRSDRFHAGVMLACASAYIFGAYAFFAYVGPASADVVEAGTPLADPRLEMARKANIDRLTRECEYHDGDPVPKCPDPVGATTVVWGDSMALAWSAGIPGSVVYSFPACAPFLGPQHEEGCPEYNAKVAARLKGDTLYLTARWTEYGKQWDMRPSFEAARHFRRVIVLGPSPKMRTTVARCIRGDAPCAITRREFDTIAKPALARLREQAKGFSNVEIADVSNDFCTPTTCPPIIDGVVLYHDMTHPSITNAKRILGRGVVATKVQADQADAHTAQ